MEIAQNTLPLSPLPRPSSLTSTTRIVFPPTPAPRPHQLDEVCAEAGDADVVVSSAIGGAQAPTGGVAGVEPLSCSALASLLPETDIDASASSGEGVPE